MKSKLLFLLSMLTAMTLSAQDWVTAQRPYFCDVQGCVLKYERTYRGNGQIRWTQTVTITDVKTDGNGQNIHYLSEFRNRNGGLMYGGAIPLEAQVDWDGDLIVDFGASVAAMVKGVVGGLGDIIKVSYEHVRMETPASLRPGASLEDLATIVKVGPLVYTIRIDQRQVLGFEDITTPAGTFHCIVTQEHKVEEGPAHNRRTISRSWHARGIGVVRHDTYSEGMEAMESEILREIRYPNQL